LGDCFHLPGKFVLPLKIILPKQRTEDGGRRTVTSGPALGNLLSQASAPLHVTGIGGPAMTTWNMGSGLYKFPGRFFCFSLYFIMSNYYKNNMKHYLTL